MKMKKTKTIEPFKTELVKRRWNTKRIIGLIKEKLELEKSDQGLIRTK